MNYPSLNIYNFIVITRSSDRTTQKWRWVADGRPSHVRNGFSRDKKNVLFQVRLHEFWINRLCHPGYVIISSKFFACFPSLSLSAYVRRGATSIVNSAIPHIKFSFVHRLCTHSLLLGRTKRWPWCPGKVLLSKLFSDWQEQLLYQNHACNFNRQRKWPIYPLVLDRF